MIQVLREPGADWHKGMPKEKRMFFMENRTFDLQVRHREPSPDAVLSRVELVFSKFHPRVGGRASPRQVHEFAKAKLLLALRLPEKFELWADLDLRTTSEAKLTLLKNIDGLFLKTDLFCDFRNSHKNFLKWNAKKQLSRATKFHGTFAKFLNNNHKDCLTLGFKNRVEIEQINGFGFANLRFQNQYNVNEFTADLAAGVDARFGPKLRYNLKGELSSRNPGRPSLWFSLDSGWYEWGMARFETEVNFATQRNHFRGMAQLKLTDSVWWNIKLKDLERFENCWGFQLDPATQIFQSISLDLDRRVESRGFVDFGVGVKVDL